MPDLSHRRFALTTCHLALTTEKERLQACILLKVAYFLLYVCFHPCVRMYI